MDQREARKDRAAAFARAAARVRAKTEAKMAACQLLTSDDVQAIVSTLDAMADKDQMQRIRVTLLRLARAMASHSAAGPVHITLDLDEGEDEWRVRVVRA